MSTHLTKKDIRQPDQFQQTLKQGFQWTTSHSKVVIGFVAVFLIIGGGLSLKKSFDLKKETEIQEKYFSIEKQYAEVKRNFDEAARAQSKSDKKAEKPVVADKKVAATGDLSLDYGKVVEGFQSVLSQSTNSKAAQMSALNLAEIYLKYNKTDEALNVLNKVNPTDEAPHMLSALLVNLKAGILADKNDCKSAVGLWGKVLNAPASQFMKEEVTLRMALCYENLNDLVKAEELYSGLTQKSAKESDSAVARDAEKYLRLLKIKKNTSGT